MSATAIRIHRYSDLIGAIDDLRTKSGKVSVALILGKIDGIGGLNARFGYSTGDKVVDAFHKKLGVIARKNDLMLELSSSSFAFVIHAPLHDGLVMLAAEKIARMAEEWLQVEDARFRLDVSMGCAFAETERADSEQLLLEAERTLQKCRASDQRMMFFEAHDEDTWSASLHPMFDAHKAIENGEFRVHYQPQFDLRSRELVGVEALVRWSGPDGLVSPASFMTELERARAMMPLLQFVTNNASRDMARWIRRCPNLNVSINSSATDLEDADLVEVMAQVLAMWNVAPSQLTLEITETSLMRDPQLGIDTLSRLRELGVRTSIDDFGTGYSSLAWLKNLPLDELKIDRSFVQPIIDDKRDRKIVESVIELAHAMDLSVVAEGIESEGVMHVLREADCDIGQGYFFSQPLTGTEFERSWLNGRKAQEGVA
jgi:diguanylate cyclase (GGDEF)-like protein